MASSAQLLSILRPAAIFLASLGIPLTTFWLLIWFRRRLAIHRADVRRDSPGCVKCLYLVRGWNGPLCPECGTDVRARGVCIGAHVPLALKLAATLFLSGAIAIVVGTPLANRLFQSHHTNSVWQFRDPKAAFEVDLRALHVRQRFPKRDDSTITLTLAPADPAKPGSGRFQSWPWSPLEPAVHPPAIWPQFTFVNGQSPPGKEMIAAAIEMVTGEALTPSRQQQADWLAGQLATLNADPSIASPLVTPPALFLAGAAGGGAAFLTSRLGVFTLLAFIGLATAIATLLCWRRHLPGFRPAIDGEWLRSTGTADAGAQQSP